jgi:hypothetical protein
MGGVSEPRKIVSLAAIHNATVMPRSFYDGPGLLAAIHATVSESTLIRKSSVSIAGNDGPITGNER